MWTSAFDFDIHSDPYVYADLKIKGVESSIRFQNDWLSLFWTYDRIDERLTLEDGTATNSPFSQPHRISLFQSLQWKKWQLSTHWRFASGRYFSLPGEIKSFISTTGNETLYIDYPTLLTEQMPNYHALDLSVFYQFKKNKIAGHIGCSISNVYNRDNFIKNEFFIDYRFDELQVSLHSWTGLPFTPNLIFEIGF